READRLRGVIASRLEELKRREFEYLAPSPSEAKRTQASAAPTREAVVLPLFKEQSPSEPKPAAAQIPAVPQTGSGVAVGDTVRVKYLTEDRKTAQITISKKKSDPSLGIVYYETPIARALLGAEVGDEVEVLVGSYVKPAIIEQIIKSAMSA